MEKKKHSDQFDIVRLLPPHLECSAHLYCQVILSHGIKRIPNHFIMTAFFPLITITICSFIMIHPRQIRKLWSSQHSSAVESCVLGVDQLTYLSTMILAVVALRLSFVDKMPRIPYLSLFDFVFLLCYFILFQLMCVVTCQQVAARLSFPAFFLFLCWSAKDSPFIQKTIWAKKQRCCELALMLVTTACYFFLIIEFCGARELLLPREVAVLASIRAYTFVDSQLREEPLLKSSVFGLPPVRRFYDVLLLSSLLYYLVC